MDISNTDFKEFRKDFKEAMKVLEAKHDIKTSIGSISYDPDGTQFTTRLTVTNETVNGKDVGQIQFDKYCGLYGFQSKDYNREFTVRGQRFKLIGFNPKAPKNCCKIKDVVTGTEYRCPDTYVKRGFY